MSSAIKMKINNIHSSCLADLIVLPKTFKLNEYRTSFNTRNIRNTLNILNIINIDRVLLKFPAAFLSVNHMISSK